MIQNIKVCNLYIKEKEDFDLLSSLFIKHPVNIINDLPEDLDLSVPTMVVGCLAFKEKFPEQNIFETSSNKNLTWSYSSKEKKEFLIDINEFVARSLKSWLPSTIELYDPFFNGDFEYFFQKNIDTNFTVFCYFNLGALYIHNKGRNFAFNIKNLSLIDPLIKDKLSKLFLTPNFLFYSYSNISSIINPNNVLRIKTLENICWIKFGVEIEEDIFFNIIPGFDIKKYIPFLMSTLPTFSLKQDEELFLLRLQEKDNIVKWLSNNFVCFSSDFSNENLDIITYQNYKLCNLNYSHKRTITGRIVCKDSYNIQNLAKEGDQKKQIISRFKDGIILVCDYISFESKIALYKSDNKEFIERYSDKDLHLESSKIIFKTEDFLPEQRSLAKDINHALMFGAGDDFLIKKLSLVTSFPEQTLYEVKYFLKPILDKANQINDFQKKFGYTTNDWGSIIIPKKEFAAFNNFCQSTAAEILTDKLFEIRTLLLDKESKFLFPVHDSLVFDISPREKEHLLKEIPKLLSKHKGNTYGISIKYGSNYKEIA